MRRTISAWVGALALVAVLSGLAAGAEGGERADPVFDRLEGTYTNEAFHDCGPFQVGWDLEYVSELVSWEDRQLGRFDHHYDYWRSTDRAALGAGDIDQTAVYDLGEEGAVVSYTLLGPATFTLADGRTLVESGAVTRGSDDAVTWQDGDHPDFKAALCEVGAAIP